VSRRPGPGVVIAAPASGSGKTTLTLGLLRSLANAGRGVASAKAGPDYIDPAFHAAASGRPCLNLDTWAMRRETLAAAARSLADGADLVICEGVMGLFDGAAISDPGADDGSTAALAHATGWPVVLVVDAGAQAASAAAVVKGFRDFRPDVTVAACVFNRVGGPRHAGILADACRRAVPDVPVLGCLPRADGLSLPERHLGLVQAAEHPDLESFLDAAAALVARHLDVDQLANLARPLKLAVNRTTPPMPPMPPLGQRIAVARDDAFRFSYPLVIDGWRAAGAEVADFSPLADQAPDAHADAVYLPGGYPELAAGRLAAAGNFLAGLGDAAKRGAAIYGECGGYMTLGRGLVDAQGQRHAMAGLLPLETSFQRPKLHLGYRRATMVDAGPLGPRGARYRGHEFHYAETAGEGPGERLFEIADAESTALGAAGLRAGGVMGSFIHLIDREPG